MDGICSNPADASLRNFLRQEEEKKEAEKGEEEIDKASVKRDGSRMDER